MRLLQPLDGTVEVVLVVMTVPDDLLTATTCIIHGFGDLAAASQQLLTIRHGLGRAGQRLDLVGQGGLEILLGLDEGADVLDLTTHLTATIDDVVMPP